MLEKIHENLFSANGVLRISVGIVFPVRMTLIVNSAKEVWLHSPISIDDTLARQIDELGRVRWIVAPSCLHHLYFEQAYQRWPDAERIFSPGLEKKRSDLELHSELSKGLDINRWPGWIESCFIQGSPKINETVFFHCPSRSLIVTDLLFNLPKEGHNLVSKLAFKLTGVHGCFAQDKLWKWLPKDRKTLRDSYQQMLKWDFERVIPAHGAVLEQNAKAQTRQALSWLL